MLFLHIVFYEYFISWDIFEMFKIFRIIYQSSSSKDFRSQSKPYLDFSVWIENHS